MNVFTEPEAASEAVALVNANAKQMHMCILTGNVIRDYKTAPSLTLLAAGIVSVHAHESARCHWPSNLSDHEVPIGR